MGHQFDTEKCLGVKTPAETSIENINVALQM